MNQQSTTRFTGSPKPKKRSMRSKKKRKYRIRNWPNYNTALVQSGSPCLWLDQETLQNWRSQERTKKRGKPKV